MINKFKIFEETAYEEALRKSQIKRDKYYVIVDMQRGLIESVQVHDTKESATNWIINFVHENFENFDNYDDVKDEFDPEELLNIFNERHSPDYEMYLYEEELSPPEKLNKRFALRKTTGKYNL